MDFFQNFANPFVPLDFSCILGALVHECQYDLQKARTPIFYGDEPLEFIVEFLEFIVWQNVIHEEEIMKMFELSMSKRAKTCYLNIPPKIISSCHEFLENFKEVWVKYEDKDLVGDFVEVLIWVKICKHKSLILNGRQKEHEFNPSKFPYDEVKIHEEDLLYLMAYAWEKCDHHGLEDQKKILDNIGEEIGFESDQLEDDSQKEEVPIQDMQKEIHDEAFEGTSDGDIENVECPFLQSEHEDENYDVLSYLILDDAIICYDYWSCFGFPLSDSSRAPSVILDALDVFVMLSASTILSHSHANNFPSMR